jgi:hypothetical protein
MNWHKRLDASTCFGVYPLPDRTGVVVHSESEISKVLLNGEIIWSVSGRDIFTNGFELHLEHIDAVDWNGNRYRIHLSDGRIEMATK